VEGSEQIMSGGGRRFGQTSSEREGRASL